jgi:hypothetical protein
MVAKWPGSTHDSHIFRTSSVAQDLEGTSLDSGVLLGDSGYPCLPYLMTPYIDPQTRKERSFNRSLKSTRSAIERAFGILKRRFHVLHGEIRMTPERVCAIIAASFVLHNIAIDHNEPEDDLEYEEDLEVGNNYQGVNTGNAVRNHITNTHF